MQGRSWPIYVYFPKLAPLYVQIDAENMGRPFRAGLELLMAQHQMVTGHPQMKAWLNITYND